MNASATDASTMWTLSAFVLASLSIGVAAFLGARRSPRAAIASTALLLGLVCGKATLDVHPEWEWALFPWIGYAFVQPLVMYPLAAAFFGVAATRLPIAWNRAVVAALGVVVVGYGAHRNTWIAWPEDHGREICANAEHHLQQSTHYTCGPAACVAALSHCGIQVSERTMARLCLTREQGSRLFDLYRGIVLALGDRPYRVSIRDLHPDEVLRAGRIVVSSNRGGGHAVCLVGRGEDALGHDPLDRTPEIWDRSRLRRDFRSPAVVVEAVEFRERSHATPPR